MGGAFWLVRSGARRKFPAGNTAAVLRFQGIGVTWWWFHRPRGGNQHICDRREAELTSHVSERAGHSPTILRHRWFCNWRLWRVLLDQDRVDVGLMNLAVDSR